MGQYTDELMDQAASIDPMDDDYQERLLEVAKRFRGFGEALTSFMLENGYEGVPEDINAKVDFLKKCFKNAGIKLPRDMKLWFLGNKKLERKTAFQICFALGLDVNGTNDFFRRVQFERGFDCHVSDEAIYYYCMRNNLCYRDAERMKAKVKGVSSKKKVVPSKEVLYTGVIIEYIEQAKSEDQLIRYINEHAEDFTYHNATALQFINKLWDSIKGSGGLAEQEGRLINQQMNPLHPNRGRKKEYDSRSAAVIRAEKARERELAQDDFVVSEGKDTSDWTVYSQIMGLDRKQEHFYGSNHNRSLASVFTDNLLMPLRTADCFPNRQAIQNMTKNLSNDNEPIRKTLILFVFYTYWVKKIIACGDVYYKATAKDSARCLASIDNYLTDCGYPALYYGNPYDWIFMWALQDAHPLFAFRGYIQEVFDVKNQNE